MTVFHPALRASARVTWKIVTFPVIAGLLLMKPVVEMVCGFALMGGLVAAVAFEISAAGPRFPFLLIAGMALGFGAFAVLYQFVLAILIRD